MADSIDLGQASQYNAFIKQNYTVKSSDVEGRVAVGGDLNVVGGYDIGTHTANFGMGDGPNLVVGGDINKSGPGSLNVYQSHSWNQAGTTVVGGEVNLSGGSIESQFDTGTDLPVNFDSAFTHLENLSESLANRTAYGDVGVENWKLDFSFDANLVPEDGVYVFNVTQDMFRTDWYINSQGLADDATIVFNISNPGSNSVDLSQSSIFINDYTDPFSSYFTAGSDNQDPGFQVLYNFHNVSELTITSDLYGTVLAPTADITSNTVPIYGQVIGKSWQGETQINYNPFDPVTDVEHVSEAPTILLIALALAFVFRRSLSKIRTTCWASARALAVQY
ncbi:choice-of-anchor A family protein [Alteromonas sediminis]|nr:choice-of-anchor A family protein [Alteromonas sediminis]